MRPGSRRWLWLRRNAAWVWAQDHVPQWRTLAIALLLLGAATIFVVVAVAAIDRLDKVLYGDFASGCEVRHIW